MALLLLDNKNNNNDYENNRSSPIPQKEGSNDDNGNLLAKLFLVDDDPDIVQVLKLGLPKNKFLVNAFTRPEEALQSFKSNAKHYCLVLSDIRMPALSGIQLARKLEKINPSVKVVLLTSFDIKDNEFSKVFSSVHVDRLCSKTNSYR